MEFLQLVLILIALIVAYKWPQKEKLAYSVLMISWVFMLWMYLGHKSSSLFSLFNL